MKTRFASQRAFPSAAVESLIPLYNNVTHGAHMSDGLTIKRTVYPVTVKEILFIWLVVVYSCGFFVRCIGSEIQNIIYLKWGMVAIIMIALSKHLLRRETLTLSELMGRRLKKCAFPELLFASLLAISTGIGSWSLLIFLSANIDPAWAYTYWNLNTSEEFQRTQWLLSWIVLESIAAVVLAPITEELVFRGFVLRRLCEKYTPNFSIVLCALLFAAVHIHQSFLSVFFVGLVCGLVAIRFSSLYGSMLVHGAYNGAILFLTIYGRAGAVADPTQIANFRHWLPQVIIFIVGTVILIIYMRRVLKSSNSRGTAS